METAKAQRERELQRQVETAKAQRSGSGQQSTQSHAHAPTPQALQSHAQASTALQESAQQHLLEQSARSEAAPAAAAALSENRVENEVRVTTSAVPVITAHTGSASGSNPVPGPAAAPAHTASVQQVHVQLLEANANSQLRGLTKEEAQYMQAQA